MGPISEHLHLRLKLLLSLLVLLLLLFLLLFRSLTILGAGLAQWLENFPSISAAWVRFRSGRRVWVVGLYSVLEGFPPGTPGFPLPSKTNR